MPFLGLPPTCISFPPPTRLMALSLPPFKTGLDVVREFVCVRCPCTFGCSLLVCPLEFFHSRQAWMAILGCALGHLFSGLLRCTRNISFWRVMCFPVLFSYFLFLLFPPCFLFLCSHLFYSFASWLVSTCYVQAYDGTLI